MDSDTLVEIRFGKEGTDRHYLGAGWSGDEPGYRWTIGTRSELWLNHPNVDSDCVLELDISPFVAPPALATQRLAVFVRDNLIGRTDLSEPRRVGLRIPGACFIGQGPVRIIFEQPDAAAPMAYGHATDARILGLCFRRVTLRRSDAVPDNLRVLGGEMVVAADIGRLTGEPAAQFMLRFESLGDNCEFGLVQRRCGAEPLGLFRFSDITIPQLLRGLDSGFEGLGDPARMEFSLQPGGRSEYVLRDNSYGLVFHTFLYQGEVIESELIAQQSTRLKFLRRKFLEDLANGEKIFVIKCNEPLAEADVLPVLAGLRRHSSRIQLLYVRPETPEHPSGTVQVVGDGLLLGYVDRFAPRERVPDLSLESWLAVCVNAAQLAGRAPHPPAAV